MPRIQIQHPHKHGRINARDLISMYEESFSSRYGLTTRWLHGILHVSRCGMKAKVEAHGNSVQVKVPRSGMTAKIDVRESQLSVQVEIPWLLRGLLPKIERRIRNDLAFYVC